MKKNGYVDWRTDSIGWSGFYIHAKVQNLATYTGKKIDRLKGTLL